MYAQRLEAAGLHVPIPPSTTETVIQLHNVKGMNNHQIFKLERLEPPKPVITDVYDEYSGGFLDSRTASMTTRRANGSEEYRTRNRMPVIPSRSAAASPLHGSRPKRLQTRLQSAPGRSRSDIHYVPRPPSSKVSSQSQSRTQSRSHSRGTEYSSSRQTPNSNVSLPYVGRWEKEDEEAAGEMQAKVIKRHHTMCSCVYE